MLGPYGSHKRLKAACKMLEEKISNVIICMGSTSGMAGSLTSQELSNELNIFFIHKSTGSDDDKNIIVIKLLL